MTRLSIDLRPDLEAKLLTRFAAAGDVDSKDIRDLIVADNNVPSFPHLRISRRKAKTILRNFCSKV